MKNGWAELFDLLESAWGIIANAYGGDWDASNIEWRKAAERWREKYHAMLAEDAAKENK